MQNSLHARHREAYLERLAAEGAAAVVPTASPKVRSNDSDYRFRPHSDFWYLTGFDEPGACLVLLPARGEQAARTVLFLRPKDKEREIWDGRRLGVEDAPAALGVDEAHDVARLWDELPELLSGHEAIAWRFGDDEDADRRMIEVFTGLRASARGTVRPPVSLLDPAPHLHEMRVIKSADELEFMRSAAQLTAAAHRDLMGFVTPGRNECEVEAFLDHAYRSNGSTGAAYGHICAGGANACILHYVENDQPLADGDLILVDSGAEWGYYAADITRTFPVNGRFSDDQRAIYEVVLRAEMAAIDAVRPGVRFDEIHQAALEVIVDGLIELGLVTGTRQEVLDAGSYRAFFMHKTSHWLGLDVHDQGRYYEGGESRALQPGMVLTVEPGLYIDPENTDVDERWRGIGVRIEDDVVVTAEGHEVLTQGAPKTVEQVEAACRAAAATTGS
ncbi:MAG: aminopeptidase P N-terminal domain-containing protein [Planctomycetota bacterium]|nr:aminopeptidase P N-terminal domain-containing protein [Planctomycetota bacterium]